MLKQGVWNRQSHFYFVRNIMPERFIWIAMCMQFFLLLFAAIVIRILQRQFHLNNAFHCFARDKEIPSKIFRKRCEKFHKQLSSF